jgi:TonB family protein
VLLERRPELKERTLRAWLQGATATSWRSFVDRMRLDVNGSPESAVTRDALGASNAEIRQATVWSIVARLRRPDSVSGGVLDKALPVGSADQATTEGTPTWESFGREIVARHHARIKTPDRAAWLATEAPQHKRDAEALAKLPYTTVPEKKAIERALGPIDSLLPAAQGEPISAPPIPSMRTPPLLWPGVLAELFAATGCETQDGGLAVAEVTYANDGGIADFGVDARKLTPGCKQLLETIAKLTVADLWSPVGDEWIILPLDRDYVACVCDPAVYDVSSPVKLGAASAIRPPKKLRDIRPIYPESLLRAKVEGSVVITALIGRTGCVTNARVTTSAQPSFDVSALRAVTAWRFSPTTVDGKPVAVTMTVTVRFSTR